MRFTFLPILIGSLLITGGEASAQFPYKPPPSPPGFNPAPRPAVSPYLNLLRPGGSPAFNYNTLVRPQLQTQQQIQGLQTQAFTFQQTVTGLEQQVQQGPVGLPPTGQPVGFMTHGSYFMNLGGTPGGGIAAPIGGGAPQIGGGLQGKGISPKK